MLLVAVGRSSFDGNAILLLYRWVIIIYWLVGAFNTIQVISRRVIICTIMDSHSNAIFCCGTPCVSILRDGQPSYCYCVVYIMQKMADKR